MPNGMYGGVRGGLNSPYSIVMGFSLLSMSEFFVFRKMETCETKNHPLCGWRQYVIHTKTPFRYDEVVQAHRNINGKVFLLWEPRLIA